MTTLLRTEFQGYVGCLVDMELMEDKKTHSGVRNLYYAGHETVTGHVTHVSRDQGHESLTTRTPDTSFYQWVPFILVFQVCTNALCNKDDNMGYSRGDTRQIVCFIKIRSFILTKNFYCYQYLTRRVSASDTKLCI